jgi:asparagine synthase (glutamine-hydrolysing)
MCGIVGVIALPASGHRVDRALVATMRDRMAHRGPDGAGDWASDDGRVVLGHRRLAIVDLSAAADQPMPNEDGTLQLVFNGEIYNHVEIRNELVATGRHRFRTDHSDTEMIVHAWEEWGPAALHRFRGMFAFALWNARTRDLWLVRDRIGIKPLYWSTYAGRLAFASEIKAILADPARDRAVNEEALFHYLSFLTSPAPDTLFQGVSKLPAGHLLHLDAGGTIEVKRWWNLWDDTAPLVGVDDQEIAERVLAELRTSVALRKMADVPVGCFLSGGIDSSANAILFSEGENRPVQTFSIAYPDAPSNPSELAWARQIVDLVGARGHERIVTEEDLLEFLPRMVELQDEPLGDPVCVPLYYVSRLARDHGVIVNQVGEGSDELFLGYSQWKQLLALQQFDDLPVPRSLKRLGYRALVRGGFGNRLSTEMLRRGGAGTPLFWGGAEGLTDSQKHLVLAEPLRKRFHGHTSWEALAPLRARFLAEAWEPTTPNWMSWLDLQLRLPELLLMRVDKMSMGASIECRVPFLDHKFVALAMSIPSAVKRRGGEPKHILKRAVRGLVPDAIIDRRKQGFDVPVQDWIERRLGDTIRGEIDRFTERSGLFDRLGVQQLLRTGRAKNRWHLLNVAMWWNHWFG